MCLFPNEQEKRSKINWGRKIIAITAITAKCFLASHWSNRRNVANSWVLPNGQPVGEASASSNFLGAVRLAIQLTADKKFWQPNSSFTYERHRVKELYASKCGSFTL